MDDCFNLFELYLLQRVDLHLVDFSKTENYGRNIFGNLMTQLPINHGYLYSTLRGTMESSDLNYLLDGIHCNKKRTKKKSSLLGKIIL